MRYHSQQTSFETALSDVGNEPAPNQRQSRDADPSTELWLLRKRFDVARCTLTGDAGQPTVRVEIDSPEMSLVIAQQSSGTAAAHATADAWGDMLRERGWIEQPALPCARPKADRRRSTPAVQ